GSAEISHQRNCGRELSQLAAEARDPVRLDGHPLGADGKSNSKLLTGRRKVGIDEFCTFRAPGHGTHEQRRAYMFSEELGAEFNLIQIDLRKCNVLEDKPLKASTHCRGSPSRKDNVEMVVLTADRQ